MAFHFQMLLMPFLSFVENVEDVGVREEELLEVEFTLESNMLSNSVSGDFMVILLVPCVKVR